MPKVPWPNFIAAHSTSYLVAAVVPKAQRRPLRQRLGMLVALLGQLKLAKAYAVTIDRPSAQEIQIAFEDEAEARRFALFRPNRRTPAIRLGHASGSST